MDQMAPIRFSFFIVIRRSLKFDGGFDGILVGLEATFSYSNTIQTSPQTPKYSMLILSRDSKRHFYAIQSLPFFMAFLSSFILFFF